MITENRFQEVMFNPRLSGLDDRTDESGWHNRIHVGDCLDIMRMMPGESVDLIVTSPLTPTPGSIPMAASPPMLTWHGLPSGRMKCCGC